MQQLKGILMPLIMVAVIAGVFIAGHHIPVHIKSFFYALSLSLKEILLFILPLMIFTFVLRSLLKLGKSAYKFVLLLVPLIVISNLCSTLMAYTLGIKWLKMSLFTCKLACDSPQLQPLWLFSLPKILSNDHALAIGTSVAIIFSIWPSPYIEHFSEKLLKIVEVFLNKFFVPLIPLFIFGFTLNLHESGILSFIISQYTSVLISIVVLSFGYIFILYGLPHAFKLSPWSKSIRNMLPAAMTGLSTMSSAAAMPLTLIGASQNVPEGDVVKAVVPATVNVHLTGDCFAITIFALALMVSFDYGIPDFPTFLKFAFYFVLAKFAVAAVPGGGILVMLPILEKNLGFSPAMLSLITALYILFDPIITSANVMGNGAFAQIFASLYRKFCVNPSQHNLDSK